MYAMLLDDSTGGDTGTEELRCCFSRTIGCPKHKDPITPAAHNLKHGILQQALLLENMSNSKKRATNFHHIESGIQMGIQTGGLATWCRKSANPRMRISNLVDNCLIGDETGRLMKNQQIDDEDE